VAWRMVLLLVSIVTAGEVKTEESTILKHSKVSWIISLLLAWYIDLSRD
jgi:hypothetical protein